MGGWHLRYFSASGERHTVTPRTLPEVLRLAYVLRPRTKPFVYYSTTGPRG